MNLKVVYTVEKPESYRSKDGVDIKSNIADDKMIDCRISKTLIDYLKKESVILEPDKLLLGFAEAQKRGIQDTLGDLDNIELDITNKSDAIHLKLIESEEANEKKYFELEKRFSETSKKINEKLIGTGQALDKDVEKIEKIYDKLNKINSYSLESLMSMLQKIIEVANKDKELVKLVLSRTK